MKWQWRWEEYGMNHNARPMGVLSQGSTSAMSHTTTAPALLISFAVGQCKEMNTVTSTGNTTDKSPAAGQDKASRTKAGI